MVYSCSAGRGGGGGGDWQTDSVTAICFSVAVVFSIFFFSPHININTQAHKTLKGTLVLIGQQNVLGFFGG